MRAESSQGEMSTDPTYSAKKLWVYSPPNEHSKLVLSTVQRALFKTLIMIGS